MSAELLREAAALMRERAEGAVTGDELRGDRWFADKQLAGTRFEVIVSDEGTIIAEQLRECDAVHIASWHPAVALAIAEWLEFIAVGREALDHFLPSDIPSELFRDVEAKALAVARAYLGRTS